MEELKEKEEEIVKKLKRKGAKLWFDYKTLEEFLDALELLSDDYRLWKIASEEIPLEYWILFMRTHIWRDEEKKRKFIENFNKYVLKTNIK